VSDTFSDVDKSAHVLEAIAWQERIDAWPQIRAYKERSYELCGDAGPRLDVGAGPGTDAVALGAIACDPSLAMARTAAARAVPVVRADIHALPFRDAAFGAVRADRVLQHVADPAVAVREMARVCAPDGRVVVCDPDQDTLRIEVPGVATELIDRVRRCRRDIGYRNGTISQQMPRLMRAAGLAGVAVEAFPLELTDPDDAFGLPGWPRYWSDHFDDTEVAEWERSVAAGRERGFRFTCSYVVTAAVRR
jgi:SAM-dependent methyltransferase